MPKKKVARAAKTSKAAEYIANDEGLIRHLDLSLIRTIETSTKLQIRDGKLPSDDISVKIEIQPHRINDHRMNVNVIAKLETQVDSKSDTPKSSVSFFCTVQCLFNSEKKLPLTEAPLVAGEAIFISCRMMAWPYIRHFVHTSALNMGIPPLILPMLFHQPPLALVSDSEDRRP